MSEEAQREFERFDWSKNNSWQQYYNNLYPTPTSAQLTYFKRKWFKRNIDSRLELEANSENKDGNSVNQNNFDTPDRNRRVVVGERHKQLMILSLSISLLLFIVLSFMNFIPFVKNSHIVYRLTQICTLLFIVGFGINLYDVSRKPIRLFTAEFWQRVLVEDSFHSLVSLVAYYGLIFNFPMIYFIPSVTAIFIVSKYQPIFNNEKLNTFFTLASQHKNTIYERRAFFETIGLSVYLILSTFTRRISVLYISLYWALIRSKYHFDPYIQYAYRVINNKVNYYLNAYSNYIPTFVPKAYKTVSFILNIKSD